MLIIARLFSRSFDADCLDVMKVTNTAPRLGHLCRRLLLDVCVDIETTSLPPRLRAYANFEDVIEADQ